MLGKRKPSARADDSSGDSSSSDYTDGDCKCSFKLSAIERASQAVIRLQCIPPKNSDVTVPMTPASGTDPGCARTLSPLHFAIVSVVVTVSSLMNSLGCMNTVD